MGLDFIVLFICSTIFILAESSYAFINCVHLLETKRKKIKKRNVPKHHQKVIAQPDVPEVQAGKAVLRVLGTF